MGVVNSQAASAGFALAAVICAVGAAAALLFFSFKSGLISLDGAVVAAGIVVGMVWAFLYFSGRANPAAAATATTEGPEPVEPAEPVSWAALIVVEVAVVLLAMLWIAHAMGWPSLVAASWVSVALLGAAYSTVHMIDAHTFSKLLARAGPLTLQVGSAVAMFLLVCVAAAHWAMRCVAPPKRRLSWISAAALSGMLLTASLVGAFLSPAASSKNLPVIAFLAMLVVLASGCVALAQRYMRSSFLDPMGVALIEAVANARCVAG